MVMPGKADERKVVDQVFILLGGAMAVAFLFIGAAAWYGYRFAATTVHNELVAQKIYFPPAGSPSFSASEYPNIQKYAGQLVDDGLKARAYANDFIGHHLEKVAEGKTYAEVSALAQKDPGNTQLQQQKATLFQGETLRGLLLGSGYAYWVFGQLARFVAIGSFIAAAIMGVLVVLGVRHKAKL